MSAAVKGIEFCYVHVCFVVIYMNCVCLFQASWVKRKFDDAFIN
jgi:hypothetical protein